MKILLVVYLIIVNLIGLIMMRIDKSRAIRHKWRIPEKTLFIIACLFGSIGILTGMYLFRHKTQKKRFIIGIPVIVISQFLIISFFFVWSRHQTESPEQVVQYELDLISQLDEEAITSFISYDSLVNSYLPEEESYTEAAEAMSLFFRDFTYEITDEEIDNDYATVTVQISNIDTFPLARDLCREILKESVEIYPEGTYSSSGDYYCLLRDTLESNTYEMKDSTVYFHLQKQNREWIIITDEELENELLSGFISYVNDPFLLSAGEVLEIHLDALKALNADGWMDYLNVNDIFKTYNTEYYSLIDEEFIRQLSDMFNCEIISCEEDGASAKAVVRVTSTDMTNVLSVYKESLLEYASTTQSIQDNSVVFSNKTSQMLLSALEENTGKSTTTDITLEISNNGYIWEVYFNSDFTNALMGDIENAIEEFNSADGAND